MPLAAHTIDDLDVQDDAFNADGLAVVFVSGVRYGGDWVIRASASADGPSFGEFETSAGDSKVRMQADPRYPDLAIESAFVWLIDQARGRGQRVVDFKCHNDRYGAGERPYFCLAQATIANSSFTPVPGVTYADEMTLDAVMGRPAPEADPD